jgi:4-carboxymuconolactone decarboxylase
MALLPYPDEASADPRAKAVFERLPVRLNLFSMLANAPSLMAETLRLGEAILTRTELDPDLRELAILRAAKLTGTEYEWVQHVPIGKAVGISDAQIEALARDDVDDNAFDTRASLVLRVVDAAIRDGQPPAELVEQAAAELGPAKLIELLLTVGYYNMLGYLMRGVRLDIDEAIDPTRLTQGRDAT